MTHVAVVGAGIAGLAAAHRLAGGGVRVTVLEAAPEVGGKLRTGQIAGLAVDDGAESFLRRRPEGLDLVAAVGLADRLVSPATTTASIWARGRLRPVPVRTVMGIPSEPRLVHGILSAAEVGRVALDRVLPGEPPAADVAVGEWVRRRLGPAVVERLVDPLLGGVYAGRADHLSLAATLPQLPRDQRSALLAARAALPDATAPAAPVFATLRGGLGQLPAAVAAAVDGHGGSVLLRRTVRLVQRTQNGWRVVHGATTDERELQVDGVILAVPAAAAARLLREPAPTAAVELAGIDAASMAIVTTAWPASAVPDRLGSGYLVPAIYRRPVKAVTAWSRKWGVDDAAGPSLVRCSIGRYGDVTDLQRDDDELVAAAVSELTGYAGFSGRPVDSRVSRWGGGLPQYAVGHRERVSRIGRALADVPSLELCGAALDGVGVPACIRTGVDAADRILAGLERPAAR